LPILTVTDFLRSSSAIDPPVLVYNPWVLRGRGFLP
jgi:hypothetical protein